MKPSWWDRVPQGHRYALVLSGSTLTSLAGIALAVYCKRPGIASRAGAISAIMGLALILVRPDYGRMSYEDRFPKDADQSPEPRPIDSQVKGLTQWLFLNSNGQDTQNRAIVIAGFIGSFFWGFGDVIAQYLIR